MEFLPLLELEALPLLELEAGFALELEALPLLELEAGFALELEALTLLELEAGALEEDAGAAFIEEYDVEYYAIDADRVANFVRNFPEKWLLPNFRGVTEEALDYMRPLIKGQPQLIMEHGLPEMTVPYDMRDCEIEKK